MCPPPGGVRAREPPVGRVRVAGHQTWDNRRQSVVFKVLPESLAGMRMWMLVDWMMPILWLVLSPSPPRLEWLICRCRAYWARGDNPNCLPGTLHLLPRLQSLETEERGEQSDLLGAGPVSCLLYRAHSLELEQRSNEVQSVGSRHFISGPGISSNCFIIFTSVSPPKTRLVKAKDCSRRVISHLNFLLWLILVQRTALTTIMSIIRLMTSPSSLALVMANGF